MTPNRFADRIRNHLQSAPAWRSVALAAAASVVAYGCMYALRKPFTVATFSGLHLAGTGIELKTALAISQMLGYVCSKYLGVVVCSRLSRRQLMPMLFASVLVAQAALVGLAVLPIWGKLVAMFINGLPLGMVWGLLMRYLEGRRATEMLVAILTCSYIASTALVKDFGNMLLAKESVPEFWMPALTGAIFLTPFLLATWLLNCLPPPSLDDRQERLERVPMGMREQTRFLGRFVFGLTFMTLAYVLVTGLRDFRDIYGIEMLAEFGLADVPGIFVQTESAIAIAVMLTIGLMSLLRKNRACVRVTFAIMLFGHVGIGLATYLLQQHLISGLHWMTFVGLGAYLAYAPYTIIFERLIAVTKTRGNSVFAINLLDSAGYTGSVAMQLYRDIADPTATRLSFFVEFSYIVSIVGGFAILASIPFFLQEPDVDEEFEYATS